VYCLFSFFYDFRFYCPQLFPACPETCPARIFSPVSLAGQVDGDAHKKRQLNVKDEKACSEMIYLRAGK